MISTQIARLHYITHPDEKTPILTQVQQVLDAGCMWVQFRWKEAPDVAFRDLAGRALELSHRYGATFIINDRVSIARELNADGVHIGKEDLSPTSARALLGDEKIIGGTANNLEDLLFLQRQPVNYIGLGPFRFTETKKKLSPVLGLEGFRTCFTQLATHPQTPPIIAIGGIQEEDLAALQAIGVHGVALSGTILKSPNLTRSCQHLLTQLNSYYYE